MMQMIKPERKTFLSGFKKQLIFRKFGRQTSGFIREFGSFW